MHFYNHESGQSSITNVLVIIKNHLHFITTWFSSVISDIIVYAIQTKRKVNMSIFIDYFIVYFKIAIAHIILRLSNCKFSLLKSRSPIRKGQISLNFMNRLFTV